MNEPFDAELGRAVKESAANSLQGWEFTPAMQRNVLDRIRAEETGTAPASRPSRRFEPGRVIRPLAWTAVAAAALLVAVNADLGGMGGSAKKSAPKYDVAGGKSSASAPQEVAPKNAQPATSPGADRQMANAPANESGVRGQGSGQGSEYQPGQSNQQAQSGQPAQPGESGPTAQPVAPAEQKATPTDYDQVAIAGAPGGPGGRGLAPEAPRPYVGGTVALQVPPADKSKSGRPAVGIMAATRDRLSAQAAGGRVVELSLSGVRTLGPDGAEAWFYPLEGVTEGSLLAVAGDGSVAVAWSNQVKVLSADGKLQRTLEPAEKVTGLVWGPDGRLAVAAGTAVTVVSPANATAEFRTEAIAQPELAFSPDGTLAVFGGGKAGRQMALYAKGGAVAMRASQTGLEAHGLAFTPGGVVAGAQAYDREGRPLWQAPIRPDGLTALSGTGLLVAWNAGTVVTLRADDGIPVWQATWGGPGEGLRKMVASPDGRFLAVLGSTEEGWVLWILDQNGKVLYAERLPDQPADMAFVGERLLLLMAQGAEFREFPH